MSPIARLYCSIALLLCSCSFVYAFLPQPNVRHHQGSVIPLYDANNNNKEWASISSDGNMNVKRPTGSLGKPKKNKKKQISEETKTLSKKERQRTGNGKVDSGAGVNATTLHPSQQGVQVVRGNRGNKTVTIVQGMNATAIDDKKKILKTLKGKLGVGGTLVDGVLEIQGTHTEKVVELLKGMGYAKARKVGK
ncbi:unnamed protein product [Cylindrotheca closterium]|uniref:SUI1 domain-containing protein n=1 Tax=Cylindrotheca closterium TaxID=2856 RepID=A0AAD2CL35_9STRA|nr:unnamed protein product [Cylindrotheca closterium]